MYNLNEEIGKRIVSLRKAHHMTQEQLAEVLNISIKHCSCVERGTSSMSLDLFIEMCDVLDTSLDYLIRGRTDQVLNLIPQTFLDSFRNADDEELAILREYASLYSHIKHLTPPDDIDNSKENT